MPANMSLINGTLPSHGHSVRTRALVGSGTKRFNAGDLSIDDITSRSLLATRETDSSVQKLIPVANNGSALANAPGRK